jgi:hypothetical protein
MKPMKKLAFFAVLLAGSLCAGGFWHTPLAHAQAVTTVSQPLRITNIQVLPISANGEMEITWETDKKSTGFADIFFNDARVARLRSPGAPRTKHTMNVKGLEDKKEYSVVIKVRPGAAPDEHFVESAPRYFTSSKGLDTDDPRIFLDTVKVFFKTGKTASISWQTDEPTNDTLRYGRTTGLQKDYDVFNKSKRSPGPATVHEVTLTSLEPFTTYHFKITAVDKNKNATTTPSAFSFTTLNTKDLERDQKNPDLEPLAIKDITPTQALDPAVTPYTATINWTTTRPTESILSISGTNVKSIRVVSDPPRKTHHEVYLTNLIPDREYKFQIDATDGQGKKVTVKGLRFFTPKDNLKAPDLSSSKTIVAPNVKTGSTGTQVSTVKKTTPTAYTVSTGLYQTDNLDGVWSIMNGQRYLVPSGSFSRYNYFDKTITLVSEDFLNNFPVARFAKMAKKKEVYRLYPEQGYKIVIPKETILPSYSAALADVITVADEDITSLADAKAVQAIGRPFIYIIEAGKKRLLSNGVKDLGRFGLTQEDVISISFAHLSAISNGTTIK